jgi:DAK2 domain fusion protein YloV
MSRFGAGGRHYAGAVPTLERETFGVVDLRRTVTAFRDQLYAHRSTIDRLNVYPVADSDTGTNLARTVDAVVAELDGAPDDLAGTCAAISHGSLMGARGNSGVILSQVLGGLASTLRGADRITATTVAEGLRAASRAADQAVLNPVEGTILTVVRASADGAESAASAGGALPSVVLAARDAARAALASTPDLLPVLRDAGVVDAGGAGYVLFLDALAHIVAGEPLLDAPDDDAELTARLAPSSDHSHGELRYEVMFICELADHRIDAFKQHWARLGDSIAVVGGDGRWNCHVHTNDVGAVIEAALDLGGRPRDIRVTDLLDASPSAER